MPPLRARWSVSSAAGLPSSTGSASGSVARGPVMPRKNLTVASLGQRRGLWSGLGGDGWIGPRVDVTPFDVTPFDVTPCRCDTMEVRNHWLVAGVRVE